MIDLTLLRTFVAVANTKNISRAAEQIHLTQPAVSLQIKQLENVVGTELFLRHPLRLTDAGEYLLAQSEHMLNQWQDILSYVQDEKDLVQGTLTIACSDTVMRFCLLPAIKQFRKRYPNLAFSILNRTSSAAKEAVLSGEADLAYALIDQPHAKLKQQPFLTYREVAAMPANHIWAQSKNLSAKQLVSETLLLLEERTQTRYQINRWFEQKHVQPVQAMSLGSVDAQIALAKAGLGVAILPEFAVPKNLEQVAISGLPNRTVASFYQRLKPAARAWLSLQSANAV
jgi:LysR family cyn operon transcriptional activator